MAPMLIIAGVEIALQNYPVRQSYELLGGSFLRRKLSGTAVKQTHWQKIKTSISGEGSSPAALALVNWAVPFTIACIEPRAIHSASNVATLPAARRADVPCPVICRAVVAGLLVATPVTVAVNTATATPVTGATSYHFMYYPILTCYSAGGLESMDVPNAEYSWSLEAEEV